VLRTVEKKNRKVDLRPPRKCSNNYAISSIVLCRQCGMYRKLLYCSEISAAEKKGFRGRQKKKQKNKKHLLGIKPRTKRHVVG
jgi:hypothetical protein